MYAALQGKFQIETEISLLGAEFISNLLCVDPNERATAEEAYEMARIWVQSLENPENVNQT